MDDIKLLRENIYTLEMLNLNDFIIFGEKYDAREKCYEVKLDLK